jgi:hypothetical protein
LQEDWFSLSLGYRQSKAEPAPHIVVLHRSQEEKKRGLAAKISSRNCKKKYS